MNGLLIIVIVCICCHSFVLKKVKFDLINNCNFNETFCCSFNLFCNRFKSVYNFEILFKVNNNF